MNRRTFLTTLGAAGTSGWLMGSRSVLAQDPAQTAPQTAPQNATRHIETDSEIPLGESRLNISDNQRDGSVYVPKSYRPGVPMPLVMMLHGFNGTSQGARGVFTLAEEFGVIVIAPESRDLTWGQSAPGFDADVRYLGSAYRYVTGELDVDRTHVALAGQSDGAGYALSMGLAYGDVFNHVMVFAGGLMIPFRKQGKPLIFIGHGINDNQMPIDRTGRRFATELKAEGYDVTLREHEGGHGTPVAIMREAFEWFLAKPSAPQ